MLDFGCTVEHCCCIYEAASHSCKMLKQNHKKQNAVNHSTSFPSEVNLLWNS